VTTEARPNKAMNLSNVAMPSDAAPFAGYGQRWTDDGLIIAREVS
jgi:hypothetical protein